MGRKAKNKQAPPAPLPGHFPERKSKTAGKKRAKSATNDKVKGLKSRGPTAKSTKERQKSEIRKRVKAIDRVDEDDSDMDDALRPG